MSGSLFIISAPSGAGKTSLVHALLNINPQIGLSVSYTTRDPRPENRTAGTIILSVAILPRHGETRRFSGKREVYGNLYGTSQAWIQPGTAKDRDILLEIDWQGAAQVRRLFPECVSIFILPPRWRRWNSA